MEVGITAMNIHSLRNFISGIIIPVSPKSAEKVFKFK